MDQQRESPWLLLIHQIPPRPNYFRVKVGRRLQKIGAVPIKNSVYVLPKTDQTQEDFQWLLREILEEGGEATLCEARLIDGLRDDQVEALFQAAREEDYLQLAQEARRLAESWSATTPGEEGRTQVESDLTRLKRRLAEIASLDFFGAPSRGTAEGIISSLEARVRASGEPGAQDAGQQRLDALKGRTWVTRTGVHIDRIASAWLIRRFIDPEAQFKFVTHKGYSPEAGELRFDMFEAEFTHEGDRCTVEVLLERMKSGEAALTPIAEIVHDIDLKDGKFGRLEAPGIASLIAGIAMAHRADEARFARGFAVFDDLLEYFRRNRG